MVMILTLAFAVLVAVWWVVGATADALIGRHVHVPDRWVVRILPGRLPSYVRQDYIRALKDRVTSGRTSTPED